MTKDIIAQNLLRLRVDQELTQDEVAQKADISPTAYKNIESGLAEPKVSTLQALAIALGVSLTDLLTPLRELKAVRFRADKKMKRRSQVLSIVARWLENYDFLEKDLVSEIKPAPFLFHEIINKYKDIPSSKERAIHAAKEIRALLCATGHFGKPDEPIRNICGLLEKSGIKIYTLEMATDSFYGLSVGTADGGPAIIVNNWDRLSVERKIFTAAHELGHLLLHINAYDIEQKEEILEEEREANFFASHFLIPEESFKRRVEELDGLPFYNMVIMLKSIYHVSYQSILVRLSENSDHWRILMEQFKIAYEDKTGKEFSIKDEAEPLLTDSDFDARPPVSKKAEEPVNLPEDSFEEARLDKLVRLAIKKDLITASKAAEILELNIEQMRKRIQVWQDQIGRAHV